MLTIKEVIQKHLLKTCTAINAALVAREERKDKKRKLSREDVMEVEKLYRESNFNPNQIEKIMKAFSILHDAPELKSGSMIPVDTFCVIVLADGYANRHRFELGKPYIVTGKDNKFMLNTNGIIGEWPFGQLDKPRYADEDEIKSCINNLTREQWATIHASDIFKPVMDQAMGQIVNVSEQPSPETSEDNGEMELEGGRTITMNPDN